MAGTDLDLAGAASLAIVPVDSDDGSAPLGSAALRELRGRPLVAWAASALVASGAIGRVVVAVPPGLDGAVRDVLAPLPVGGLEVLAVRADGPVHRLLAALRSSPAGPGGSGDAIVVVHDPLHPLSSAALVRDVVRGLLRSPACAAAAPANPVTDTLKWVDEDDAVLGTADRDGYRTVGSPQAHRRDALLEALQSPGGEALRDVGVELLPHLVRARGHRVALVPSLAEAFRVATADDLVLAEALLQVDVTAAGGRTRPAGAPRRRGRADRSP